MLCKTFLTALIAAASPAMAQRQALVYRGPAACSGCPESVANLLRTSPSKFNVTFAGPNEAVDITAETLSKVDVYAQAGGGGLSKTWPKMKPYSPVIRDFVANGGRYLGFCLGAYLAGTPGFDILPPGDNTNEECIQPGAEVKDSRDTIIKVNWHFSTGSLSGKTQTRWVYFQDGAVMKLPNQQGAKILGRYSSNRDIAASVTPFGKGWVGATGPHPEADKSWYKPYKLRNPDGINFDVGHDFVEATMQAGTDSTSAARTSAASIGIATMLVFLICIYTVHR